MLTLVSTASKALALVVISLSLTSLISCNSSPKEQSNHSPAKPNILFISIDDLRPEIGVYGGKAVTPNLDALAQQGIVFTNAFAQQAICGPSRASVMTGVRPDTLGVTHNYVKFRDNFKDVVTIPQHFEANGYNTAYVGKIFHHGDKDDDLSWNLDPAYHLLPESLKKPGRYALDKNTQLQTRNRKAMFQKYGEQARFGLGSGPASEGADVPDNRYGDGFNTDLAIVTIRDILAKSDKPLFFGFGMNKPHLPWIAPKKYWDLYDPTEIELSTQHSGPKGGAEMGLHASFEVRTFYDVPNYGSFSNELSIELKHAYLASVSYVDAQIGRLIKDLKETGVLDNTIIIVWSDHGYHLGEMGIWGKASNYEIAARVPMMISTPEMRRDNVSLSSDALVELVDIFPTLADLAGIEILEQLEGQSMRPLLEQPDREWKKAAFSQFPTPALREWGAFPLRKGMRETYFGPLIKDVEQRIQHQQGEIWDRELFEHHLMGYSMRTQQYRFIVWKDTRNPDQKPVYIELYDHDSDPNETSNIASNKPAVVAKLMQQLEAGWQGSLPVTN